MKAVARVCILVLLAFNPMVESVGPRTSDQRLGDYLMQNYTMTTGRPVLKPQDKIELQVSISILNLEEINSSK